MRPRQTWVDPITAEAAVGSNEAAGPVGRRQTLDPHLASRARSVHELVSADDDARRARRVRRSFRRTPGRRAAGPSRGRSARLELLRHRARHADPVSARRHTKRSRCNRSRRDRCRHCDRASREEPARFPRPRQARPGPARDPAPEPARGGKGRPGTGTGGARHWTRRSGRHSAQTRTIRKRMPFRAMWMSEVSASTRRTDKSGGTRLSKPL